MSGGSFDYMYSKIRDTYKGELHDQELEEMLEEFCDLLQELEWWQSGDTSEEQYINTVHEFKQHWIERGSRACYPVHMTSPGPFPQHSSGYFDPTRRLLFTGYMTDDLAKNLGFKWWRE